MPVTSPLPPLPLLPPHRPSFATSTGGRTGAGAFKPGVSPGDALNVATHLYNTLSDPDPRQVAPPVVISARIRCLHSLSVGINHSAATSTEPTSLKAPDWEQTILSAEEKIFEGFLLRGRAVAPAILSATLFATGEVVLASDRARPSQNLVMLLQSLLAPRITRALPASVAGDDVDEAGGATSETITLPSQVRAHAFTALGKLCLKHQPTARANVLMFVRELDGPDPVVRNNAMIILCDICRTFTSIVDPYVVAISASLRDSSPMVRRHAIMVISQLLLEDYVKWRGSLFFRLITCIADEDEGVQACARQAITALVAQKSSQQVQQNFVASIYFLNGCSLHPGMNKVVRGETFDDQPGRSSVLQPSSSSSSSSSAAAAAAAGTVIPAGVSRVRATDALFSLAGPENAARRMAVYSFLLSLQIGACCRCGGCGEMPRLLC